MSQQNENLDFSGLFKLDVLIHLDIINHSFYEVGLKKFLALSSDRELLFLYINPQSERFDHVYDWDFLDNPVYCMCFEPSGTWMLIVSDQKVLLVPFLPLFIPQSTFDHKWSLTSVTVLPLGEISKPTSVVWWLTKESENIIIIGSKSGVITFYSMESQCIVGETRVTGEVHDLQICFDDSLDLLALLISRGQSQQWKLVLEHRSFGYNWLQQMRSQTDKEKKDSFMSYIKQLSKDKITFFIQGGSKDDNKSQTVEYVLKPAEYLPSFRKGSNKWSLSAQYVNGRHFLTAFELNEGTIILESPEEAAPSRTLRPIIKKDGLYIQGLWTPKLIYLLRKNELEIHSANFAVVQGEAVHGVKRDFSELWSAELIGDVHKAYLMSAREPPAAAPGWQEPTFMCDLQLPRFNLEPCLVITNCGAYILNTVCEPCEWLVGVIMRGGAGAEQAAAGLGAPVPALLRAAADMLLSRGKLAPAIYLFSLSQSQPDGWVARLGVFGRLHELSMYKQTANLGSLGNSALTVKLLASLLKVGTNSEERFDTDVRFQNLSQVELSELTSIAACIGLWDLVPLFSIHHGFPSLMLSAIRSKSEICRGALVCLLRQRCMVPILLEENGQWLFDFITEKCNKFDTMILKCLCLWLNPMQDQLRAVMRDLKQGITSIYATRMLQLISTFMQVASVIESRQPCPEIHMQVTQEPETWKSQFTAKRAISCGLAHWAIVDEGNVKIMMTPTPVNTELIGRVIDVACGRHHTLVLTENGIYASGDNRYGQLGVGAAWAGAVGEAASAAGALLMVQRHWQAPIAAIAAGHYHSAAVDMGGRVYTWGWGVHGQLCLGTIDDQCTPQLVTKFQGRKVESVGCGACHTVVAMRNGEVWASGAGVFGQLGGGARGKAAWAQRVPLPDPALAIAVGYFHNLALTVKGQLWCWGASPQQVRAAHARRASEPSPAPSPAVPTSPATPSSVSVTPSPAPVPSSPTGIAPSPTSVSSPATTSQTLSMQPDPHLLPQLVNIKNVKGTIVQLAAGWHHSCLLSSTGKIYTWGLNFDGQLGSGDRKQVQIPTEVKFRQDPPADASKDSRKSPETEPMDSKMKALVACGGDFTIYVDDDGRIYATGNMHLQVPNEKEKTQNRVIMMKTTKRVIKIPASRSGNKFLFQPIDRIDIMFPFDIDDLQRKPIEPSLNPLISMNDFKKKSWADDIILLLKPWINKETLSGNLNMAAKLAFHNKAYAECLHLLLKTLLCHPPDDQLYFTHHENVQDENRPRKQDERKIIIANIMSKRIKDISLSILNEVPYPVIDNNLYQSLPCCCDEMNYFVKDITPKSPVHDNEENLSLQAAMVIDKCISNFPIDSDLWETCFRLSKNFYLNNNLSIDKLEAVLTKYMESNASTMAAAILYSNDCAQYVEILSPKFYLNVCNEILDTWG